MYADDFHFVMTESGLKDPGAPSRLQRPQHSDDWSSVRSMEFFDPSNTGTYPPRPPELEVFSDLKYHHLHRLRVEDIAATMMVVKPDPETDVQPSDCDGLSWVDVEGTPQKIAVPLELFDYAEMDLVHPSHDVLKVRVESHFGL